jgi:hypothetical protein
VLYVWIYTLYLQALCHSEEVPSIFCECLPCTLSGKSTGAPRPTIRALRSCSTSAETAAVLGIIGPSLNDVPISLKVRFQKATARVPLVEVHGHLHDVRIVPSWVC